MYGTVFVCVAAYAAMMHVCLRACHLDRVDGYKTVEG